MLNGTPAGSKGAVQPTGWMTRQIFVEWLDHFTENTQCSNANPVLLIMDNHVSHITKESLQYAKSHGILHSPFLLIVHIVYNRWTLLCLDHLNDNMVRSVING